ncbi:hypothetical protein T492DRAFT_844837 [Pavlovales sp. CCMP2436]|nr:hypothetical protein T492DRAFT_844837 [Pavlovales sp. CCMP2436]
MTRLVGALHALAAARAAAEAEGRAGAGRTEAEVRTVRAALQRAAAIAVVPALLPGVAQRKQDAPDEGGARVRWDARARARLAQDLQELWALSEWSLCRLILLRAHAAQLVGALMQVQLAPLDAAAADAQAAPPAPECLGREHGASASIAEEGEEGEARSEATSAQFAGAGTPTHAAIDDGSVAAVEACEGLLRHLEVVLPPPFLMRVLLGLRALRGAPAWLAAGCTHALSNALTRDGGVRALIEILDEASAKSEDGGRRARARLDALVLAEIIGGGGEAVGGGGCGASGARTDAHVSRVCAQLRLLCRATGSGAHALRAHGARLVAGVLRRAPAVAEARLLAPTLAPLRRFALLRAEAASASSPLGCAPEPDRLPPTLIDARELSNCAEELHVLLTAHPPSHSLCAALLPSLSTLLELHAAAARAPAAAALATCSLEVCAALVRFAEHAGALRALRGYLHLPRPTHDADALLAPRALRGEGEEEAWPDPDDELGSAGESESEPESDSDVDEDTDEERRRSVRPRVCFAPGTTGGIVVRAAEAATGRRAATLRMPAQRMRAGMSSVTI